MQATLTIVSPIATANGSRFRPASGRMPVYAQAPMRAASGIPSSGNGEASTRAVAADARAPTTESARSRGRPTRLIRASTTRPYRVESPFRLGVTERAGRADPGRSRARERGTDRAEVGRSQRESGGACRGSTCASGRSATKGSRHRPSSRLGDPCAPDPSRGHRARGRRDSYGRPTPRHGTPTGSCRSRTAQSLPVRRGSQAQRTAISVSGARGGGDKPLCVGVKRGPVPGSGCSPRSQHRR
jgi:hypothetical protein